MCICLLQYVHPLIHSLFYHLFFHFPLNLEHVPVPLSFYRSISSRAVHTHSMLEEHANSKRKKKGKILICPQDKI